MGFAVLGFTYVGWCLDGCTDVGSVDDWRMIVQAIETIYYPDDDDWLGPDWEAIEALALEDWDENGA